MTSERNKRVEEESANKTGRRDGKRGRVNKRGRDRCPCGVKEGSRENWQRAVELLRETEGRTHRSRGNPNEAQLPAKTIQPYSSTPQPVGEEGKPCDPQTAVEAFQLNLKNLLSKLAGGAVITESHWTANTKSPRQKLVVSPTCIFLLKFGLYRGRRAPPTVSH